MDSQSRTAKSIKNSIVALIMYTLNLVLQFFSRKIFLDYLGTEILGLNTTASNILQFLNLAELGISNAVAFSLYKPIHDNDKQTINEIVSLQGHIYKRIALIIIGGAAVLMCFFPWIFSKMELPIWYAYLSFGVLLLSSLLGYFVNYRQIILSASQQEYKVTYSYKTVMLIKVLFQMFAVWKLRDGYIWWAIFEALFAILGAFVLHTVTMRNFPYLMNVPLTFRELRKKYNDIETKIKQLFFHKIGAVALTQTSPIIIYAYANLTIVAMYGNYMIINMGILMLIVSIFNGQNASVGDLVAEGNKENIIHVFQDLFCIRFIIVSTICYCAYFIIPPFITLWIGAEYLLPNFTLIILLISLYIQLFRPSVETFTNAFGLFSDIFAPVIEVIINISLSICLGYYWGLNGILLGVLSSQIIVIVIWKPYYLFSRCLYNKIVWYIKLYLKHLLLIIPGAILVFLFCEYSSLWIVDNWIGLIISAIIVAVLFIVPLTILSIISNRTLIERITSMFKR